MVHDLKVHFLIHHNSNLDIDEIATRLWGFGGAVLRSSALGGVDGSGSAALCDPAMWGVIIGLWFRTSEFAGAKLVGCGDRYE